MATKLINIPLSLSLTPERAIIAQHQGIDPSKQVQDSNTEALAAYDQLRSEGWSVDSASAVVQPGRSDIVLILHRPDKMPLTISQEFSEAYRTLLNIERDLGMNISDDNTLSQHIAAVYEKMQQCIRDAEIKHQPIGDLNGTEED